MRVATIGRVGRALLVCGLLAVIVSAATTRRVAAGVPALAALRPALAGEKELVVLVHGMGRSRMSMWLMGRALEREGYRVVNWGYSSTSRSIPELGAELAEGLREELGNAPRVHFVGHSLGNIIVRWALTNQPPPRVGRVVMLAPPNQGSASADRWSRWVGWLLPPIRELRTDSSSTVRTLPIRGEFEVGVIAGADDGKVSVDETHLDGEREHVVVPSAHTFIMNRGDVQALVVRFLRTGTFGAGIARPAHPEPRRAKLAA